MSVSALLTRWDAWLNGIPGLREYDRITAVGGNVISQLSDNTFIINNLPVDAISIPLSIERKRKDGFIGVEKMEFSVPIPPRLDWRVRRMTSWDVPRSTHSTSMLGLMKLGGREALVFVNSAEIGAIDMTTGCHRTLYSGTRENAKYAVLRKTIDSGWLLHVAYHPQGSSSGIFWNETKGPTAMSQFSRWKAYKGGFMCDSPAASRNFAPLNCPCQFRAECALDVDNDGELDFVSPQGARIVGTQLDFSNVKRWEVVSAKTGNLIYQADLDSKTVATAPGFQALSSKTFGDFAIEPSTCVHADIFGDERPEKISVANKRFDIASVPRKPNDVSLALWFDTIAGMPSLLGGEQPEAISMFDTNADGSPEVQVFASTNNKADGRTVKVFEISTGKQTKITRPLCHGTPEGRIDEKSIAAYLSGPISLPEPISPPPYQSSFE